YIADDFKNVVQITFYITLFGFMLKMMIENFEFKIESIKKILLALEGRVFYLITWFMIVYVLSSFVLLISIEINLDVNPNYLFVLFGSTGACFTTFIKKKDIKE